MRVARRRSRLRPQLLHRLQRRKRLLRPKRRRRHLRLLRQHRPPAQRLLRLRPRRAAMAKKYAARRWSARLRRNITWILLRWKEAERAGASAKKIFSPRWDPAARNLPRLRQARLLPRLPPFPRRLRRPREAPSCIRRSKTRSPASGFISAATKRSP